MKQILTILLITNSLFAQSNFENDSILLWNSKRKINLNDFTSENKTHEYEQATAVIAPSLILIPRRIHESNISSVKIVAIMYKNESWSKSIEDYVILHEQGHFDITEIFARKFRKKMAEVKVSEIKIDVVFLTNLFNSNDIEHWDFQFQYESETQRGTNYKMQQIWNEKIKRMLEELKDFESDIYIDEIK